MKVALLVFTWNEVEGMKVIMPRVGSDLFHQIIIVDGGSTDGTIEWAREQGYQVHVQTQKGLRHAYNEALELVTGDIVITFSPDGNSIPELLPDLIAKMEDGFDMVIASRYLDGAKSEDDSLITAFGNWLFTATVNVLYGGSYTDCMVIYRAWRSSLYKELDIHLDETFEFYEKLYRTKLGIEPLLSVRALKRNLKVGEIPGDEPPRIGGHRKLQIIKWGLSFYTSFFRELWFWK